MSFDVSQIRSAVAQHGSVARVVIASHAGSTPRETGTAMLVWANGQSGTIGGGALEFDALREARRGGRARFLSRPLGPSLGQCCGGHVTLLIEPVTPAFLRNVPRDGVFARNVSGPEPAPLAVRRLVAAGRKGARQAPTVIDGWFIEPVSEPPLPLWLFGAGHVGRALVRTLADLPVEITWIDDAPTRFPEHIAPHATRLLAADAVQAVRHAPENAHHLVLTYSHALDLALCHAILQRPFASLGLIGSATKKARFLKRLAEMGHPPERLSRLICPIGDPALGKHPQAIAISVAHRLLSDRTAAAHGQDKEHVA